jgi:hypothetical protein
MSEFLDTGGAGTGAGDAGKGGEQQEEEHKGSEGLKMNPDKLGAECFLYYKCRVDDTESFKQLLQLSSQGNETAKGTVHIAFYSCTDCTLQWLEHCSSRCNGDDTLQSFMNYTALCRW